MGSLLENKVKKMNTGEINRKLDINSEVKYPSKCYQIQKSVS